MRLTFIVPPEENAHGVARKIKDRIWSKFKIAVSDLAADNPNQVVIGASLVDHDETRARNRMQQVVQNMNEWGHVNLVNDETEVIHFNDLELERDFEEDFEKFEP